MTTPAAYCLWHRRPGGRWRMVYQGPTAAACGAEQGRLIIRCGLGGDFCTLPAGQSPAAKPAGLQRGRSR